MQSKYKKDIIGGALFIVFSAIMIFYAIPQGVTVQSAFGASNTGVNGRTFPYFISVIILISGIAQIAIAVMANHKSKQTQETATPKKAIDKVAVIKVAIVMALFVLFGIIFSYLGTIAAIIIIFPLILFTIGAKKISYYIAAYSFAAVMYILFTTILNISLP